MERYGFSTLYSKFYRKSFLFTKSYVHDGCVAEDIVSDVLIKLWELQKENPIEHLEALLLTSLRNRALDYLKHEVIKQEALHSLKDITQRELDIRISTLEACNPDEIFSTEIQRLITSTLDLLPEQTKRVFTMSRFENRSNREIAEELQLSVKGVEYHISKALKPLREALKDYLPLFYFYLFF